MGRAALFNKVLETTGKIRKQMQDGDFKGASLSLEIRRKYLEDVQNFDTGGVKNHHKNSEMEDEKIRIIAEEILSEDTRTRLYILSELNDISFKLSMLQRNRKCINSYNNAAARKR